MAKGSAAIAEERHVDNRAHLEDPGGERWFSSDTEGQ